MLLNVILGRISTRGGNLEVLAFPTSPISTGMRPEPMLNGELLIINSQIKTSATCADEEEKMDIQGNKRRKREKVMAFLRKTGRISANRDFTTAMGVDEGPCGKKSGNTQNLQKSANAYQSCTKTGIIDDFSESFPKTSSGTEWSGFTDKVMGGVSMGMLLREKVNGRNANVLKGKVSLYNNGGFIQMATNLAHNPVESLTVDASDFDGIELNVLYQGSENVENFNVHLRNPACLRQFSSYRGTFEVRNNEWETIRLPWSSFVGHGPGSENTPFSPSELKRIGVVAIGKAMEVYLAVSSIGFYKES